MPGGKGEPGAHDAPGAGGRDARDGGQDSGEDYLVRAIAGDGSIRALACRTTRLVDEARRRHDTWPTATAALGRVLTATALLAAQMKAGGNVTVRVTGSGPLGVIVATGEPGGDVRGYVGHPHVDLPLRPDGKLDVGGAVGLPGFLHVTRDLGLGRPYTGSVPLASGEIGDDLTAFFARSDQTPSVVGLGVLVAPGGGVRAAGGFVLQLLPGHKEDWAERLEANIQHLSGISRRIEAGMTPEEMLRRGLDGLAPEILDRQPLRFRCRCSRERVERALVSLGPDELAAMLREDGGAELRCHFCGETYRLDGADLARLRDEALAGQAAGTGERER